VVGSSNQHILLGKTCGGLSEVRVTRVLLQWLLPRHLPSSHSHTKADCSKLKKKKKKQTAHFPAAPLTEAKTENSKFRSLRKSVICSLKKSKNIICVYGNNITKPIKTF
jgi:hypothetical protein